jgi:hypothetical protein
MFELEEFGVYVGWKTGEAAVVGMCGDGLLMCES